MIQQSIVLDVALEIPVYIQGNRFTLTVLPSSGATAERSRQDGRIRDAGRVPGHPRCSMDWLQGVWN